MDIECAGHLDGGDWRADQDLTNKFTMNNVSDDTLEPAIVETTSIFEDFIHCDSLAPDSFLLADDLDRQMWNPSFVSSDSQDLSLYNFDFQPASGL